MNPEDCYYRQNGGDCEKLALTYSAGPQGPQGPPYSCYCCSMGKEVRRKYGVYYQELIEFNHNGVSETSPGAADWIPPNGKTDILIHPKVTEFIQAIYDMSEDYKREAEKYLDRIRREDGNQLENLCLNVGFAAKASTCKEIMRKWGEINGKSY